MGSTSEYTMKAGSTSYVLPRDDVEPAPVWDVSFPDRSAFLFGEERNGLSPEAVEECDRSVFIPMNGIAPRSLNVGHAAAIIIGEYARQHRFGMGR